MTIPKTEYKYFIYYQLLKAKAYEKLTGSILENAIRDAVMSSRTDWKVPTPHILN